jgi:Transposase DDE domain
VGSFREKLKNACQTRPTDGLLATACDDSYPQTFCALFSAARRSLMPRRALSLGLWLLDKGITPHIPAGERYQRADGMFPCPGFAYDAERDIYLCPSGKPLRASGTIHDGRVRNYLSRARECRVCNLKERCTRAPFRKIVQDVNEDARDHARSLKGTPEFEQSRNERKKVEMRLAHLKVNHRFERMRPRGLTGARDELHFAAIGQNLKTLASYVWLPPPDKQAAARVA